MKSKRGRKSNASMIRHLNGWRLYLDGTIFSLEQLGARFSIRVNLAVAALSEVKAALRERQHSYRRKS